MLFETPSAPDSAQRRYQSLPHPFVLEPEVRSEREIQPGTSLYLGMTLMGKASEQVPYLIHALNVAGRRGMRRTGGRFSVVAVVAIVVKRLRWCEWTRFSSRQNTRMQMGGLLGEIVLEGDALPDKESEKAPQK